MGRMAPLKTQLGNIAKSGIMAPMTYLEWTYMRNELLDRMWKEVMDNTDAPEQYITKCLANISVLWRGWKSRENKKYDKKLETNKLKNVRPSLLPGLLGINGRLW
ncbi:hypothetical protein Dsin_011921 [Dipteronia sinensis]|uniref:Uncharacterized protein n=1 Tax=Dipteronia sinensis TaxID=43782 RepID=A0AAE0AHA4_9ROSI|nr:hypothetical protein Dsin_011921 [Dipteronia sinensis]